MRQIMFYMSLLIIPLAIFTCGDGENGGVEPEKDTTPPYVVGISPLDGATGVQATTVILAIFSESMHEASINDTTCLLKRGTADVPCTRTYNDTTKTVTIEPSADLEYGQTYTATITSYCTDLAGNGLNPEKSWSFSTVLSNTGTILGHVEDTYLGEGIPNANVTVGFRVTQTDANGDYSFEDVMSGVQKVAAHHQLYDSDSTDVDVPQGGNVTADFSLVTTEIGEPNDFFGSAYMIASGDTHTSYIRLSGDSDYFSIPAYADEEIIVFVKQVPDLGSPDLTVRIYDPIEIQKVEEHLDDPGPCIVSHIAEMSGDHYIYFDGYTADYFSNENPYVFWVTVASSATGTVAGVVYDAYIGDGYSEPVGKPLGATVCLYGTSHCDVTTSNGEYTLSDVRAGLRTLEIIHPLYETLIEHVMVNAGETVNVPLSLYTTDLGEPNDSYAEATEVTTDTDYTAYIRIGTDVDYYKINLAFGNKLDILMKHIPSLGNPDLILEVFDPIHAEKLEQWMDGPGPVTISYTAQTPGYHFIRFSAYRDVSCSNEDPYTFNLSIPASIR
jgi:hypothetical protein